MKLDSRNADVIFGGHFVQKKKILRLESLPSTLISERKKKSHAPWLSITFYYKATYIRTHARVIA